MYIDMQTYVYVYMHVQKHISSAKILTKEIMYMYVCIYFELYSQSVLVLERCLDKWLTKSRNTYIHMYKNLCICIYTHICVSVVMYFDIKHNVNVIKTTRR